MRAVFGGEHHWPRVTKHAMPRFWECSHLGELATYDGDKLTRLVFAAHKHCIRASVGPSGPGRVKIMLHNRKGREGQMHERHPTIETALCR
jgi:hypothetical protein